MRSRSHVFHHPRSQAYLYSTAVGVTFGNVSLMRGDGFTALSETFRWPGGKEMLRARQAQRTSAPMIRLDQAVQSDVWLLKLDVQGYELHALEGAAALLRNFTVAHVYSEFNPRFLTAAGAAPLALYLKNASLHGAATIADVQQLYLHDRSLGQGQECHGGLCERGGRALVDRLKYYGFLCFDLRDGDDHDAATPTHAPWALGRSHPLKVAEYMVALENNNVRRQSRDEHGTRLAHGAKANWYRRGASFDDLACVNVARAWPHAGREARPLIRQGAFRFVFE